MSKGKKHTKKKHLTARDVERNELAIKKEKRDAAFKKNKRHIFPLIINTVTFFTLYSYLVNISEAVMMATLWCYFGLTAAFCLAYIIYNRGFSRLNVTPEMLPASMSDEEKREFIEEAKLRIEKSKWMLTIIFPLIMTFILDILNIWIFDPMMELAGISLSAAATAFVSLL
jgi:membrane-anchored glycerophosphoryl diester phosphodiesterase (GDPDase)